ncbi:pirin family protein [Paenibacillus sp. SYP-B4298]|uniref:pirin family protein n=1 Tax=Paenibacillus sp. SYP-B4298 TaxID=2996034 RepID=UPI0022DD0534|nr:pirin family protein [Paenibacillus sp. SYP-B4298]
MSKQKQHYERGIEDVWSAVKNQIHRGHENSFILEPGPGNWEKYDPFLFLAEDWFQRGSFDTHPHRGIETVTYVMEGVLEHYDSSTNGKDELRAGDAQWMTAGRGVIHKEDPAPGETVHSLQLWVNLPASHKMTEPHYQNLRAETMPVREEEGVSVRIFSGSSGGVQSSTRNIVPVTMLEVTMEAGAVLLQELPSSYNGFIFVLEGEARLGRDRIACGERQAAWLGEGGSGEWSSVRIEAITPLRVLLYAGEPLHEPIAARGPFVMNTEEELRQAYQDYRDGKFI